MHGGSARTMRCGELEAEFRPEEGGRLTRLQYAGVDLVLPPGRVPGFHGDTFWPSPQARFDWPPPRTLDTGPYEVLAESGRSLALRSAPDQEVGLLLEKRFELGEHCVGMEFTLTNIWPEPQDVAPWQVTRAPRSGMLVWATGQPFQDADRLQKQREDPGCWFLHRDGDAPFEGLEVGPTHCCIRVPHVSRRSKLFADASGWLAHVHDATLFLRTFPDLTLEQMAPRQGEVELFFDPERDYIELENQGRYVTLQAGQSLTYAVEWRMRGLGPAIPDDRLTDELLAEIHALL